MASPPSGSTPAGLLEGFIQLPPDSSGKQVRAFPVLVYQLNPADLTTWNQQTVYQQVFMIADDMGNIMGTKSAPLQVTDGESQLQMNDIYDVLVEIRDLLKDNK